MFCGVGARRGQESEGNGSLGFPYCPGAREERAAGSARGCPRRRRGGGRRGGSGSCGARGTAEELQREATGGEEVVRDAWVPAHGEVMAGKAGKAPAGGAVGGVGGEKQSREGEEGDKGDFAISKSFRD